MTAPSAPDGPDESARPEPLVSLPKSLRHELKDPVGPIETDSETLLGAAGDPLVTVGDVVTYHVLEAGRRPDVALVDGITERAAVDAAVRETVTAGETVDVANPQGTITAALAHELVAAIDDPEPVTILVDGEEDLAVLPAIVTAPEGASVVYGQPGEGMVHAVVTDELRAEIRSLLAQFDGDTETLFWILDR
ncbi:GTP-dependent dephospho-CoA kinase family protein [Halovivax limisalsi]|uniref:GTP-dependent dephospho-CoA kinase family protein n=1 Tax=Halovivax limisalsi TaxID=1453760 RepID=UPI001FFD6336|nr:GTP-dependent dephospho-CoA kinase family protein [Halovivax limisalsi]